MVKNKGKKYDIFLSYRRDGGAETAKHLCDSLAARGYSVFLDVESLRSGPFNEALYRVIERAKDFLLILPEGGLDRCVNEDDWVRLEIEHARACGKNIVPVMLRGFSFPAALPESIDFIRYQNGPTAAEMEYYDAFVDRLEEFLLSKPWHKWKSRTLVGASLALACALAFTAWFCLTTYPLTRKQDNTVSALISYLTLNMTKGDVAGTQYLAELDRALQYVQGQTTDSEATLRYELWSSGEEIRKSAAAIGDMPDRLREQLMTSPFDVGDLDVFKPALTGTLLDYADRLDYVRDVVIPDESMRAEHKAEYLRLLRQIAELDADMFFYMLNETLLPVTKDAALAQLKNEQLPLMSFFYAKRLDMTHDRGALLGKEEAVFRQYDKLLSQYEESVQKELERVDTDKWRAELEQLVLLCQNRGVDATALEARIQRLLDKSAELDEKKEQVIDLSRQLDEKRREAYEKFKPSAQDDPPLLWGKGKRFLTLNMPEAAAECFALYAEKGGDEERVAGTAGRKFAENWTALELEGGVVVCRYEENLPAQAVELGDIIIKVDGAAVRSYADFDRAMTAGDHSLSLLRFTPDGYSFLEAAYDGSRGRLAVLGLTDDASSS